jgi:hypothetical protein
LLCCYVVVLLCCCVVVLLCCHCVVLFLCCCVVMLLCCYVVVLLCCQMYIPDLPTYLEFYLKTTRGISIYSTYLIYPDLFILHANNTNDNTL